MKEKGITLIALVVTIIILLILVGIGISELTGEKGIINKAIVAVQQKEISDIKELAQIDIMNWKNDRRLELKFVELNNEIIRDILKDKDYVKEAKSTSFITKDGGYKINYSELYDAKESFIPTKDIKENQELDKDYTEKINVLGNPLKNKYPTEETKDVISRRPWDMQLYNKRIYIGSGDYDQNTGPVDVYYYDIDGKKFVNEGTLNDEQINRFVIIDDTLIVPGTDPKDDWSMGNYYYLDNNTWKKQRSVTGGVHNFDMIKFKDKIFAGLGAVTGSSVVVSGDNGKSFSCVDVYDISNNKIILTENNSASYRFYDLFEFKNELYGFCNRKLYKYNEVKNRFEQQTDEIMNFGSISLGNYVHLKNKIVFKDKFITVNGAVKVSNDLTNYKVVRCTGSYAEYAEFYDVIERDGYLYFLGNTQQGNETMISVYKTSDCINFDLELYFKYKGKAFSFEKYDNKYYFGIAESIWSDAKGNTGQILEIEL